MTPHAVTPHRCESYAYHCGNRFGWECGTVDCDAGGSGFYTLAAAETAAYNHSVNNWGRP